MRKRAKTHIQRHSAHAAIIAKQLAMNFVHFGNDSTPSLPLTRPQTFKHTSSDDSLLSNKGTTCRVVHGHAAGRSLTVHRPRLRHSALTNTCEALAM